ncbi:G1/S-specific cyclin-E3 isoform X1 [Oreochromis niloticus]|uniref:G1/S-specific cyclin-E3 isoform X1 n=2 Tax=Oreochromis niloticus TaxID=8128 RepID=UPI0009046B8D|nr:G1/S-specific cyclin-E3 isoform X1 [Oreochromis niloticus]
MMARIGSIYRHAQYARVVNVRSMASEASAETTMSLEESMTRRRRLKRRERETSWLGRKYRKRENTLYHRLTKLITITPKSPLQDAAQPAAVSLLASGRLFSLHPYLGCESSDEEWVRMIGTPRNISRSSVSFVEKQPVLTPRMRSIVLYWLMEVVCEAYAVHRETFYLAQDYFDRFLLIEKNLKLGVLQLTVLTCLLIASKMEESKPLKILHLSRVAHGIYHVEEFRHMELVILRTLRWYTRPETALSWLKFFLQVIFRKENSNLLEQPFPKDTFMRSTNLLDLCILDVNSMDMPYHGLAASVLCYFVDQELVEKVARMPRELLQSCVDWLAPFMDALEDFGTVTRKVFPTVRKEDQHNIQANLDYMSILDVAHKAIKGKSPKKDMEPVDATSYRERIYVPGQGLTSSEDEV